MCAAPEIAGLQNTHEHQGDGDESGQQSQGGDGLPEHQPGSDHRDKGIEVDEVVGGDDAQKTEGFIPEDEAQGTSDQAQEQQIPRYDGPGRRWAAWRPRSPGAGPDRWG